MKTFVVTAGKFDDEQGTTVSYSSEPYTDIQIALSDMKTCNSYPWSELEVMIDDKLVHTYSRYDLALLSLI